MQSSKDTDLEFGKSSSLSSVCQLPVAVWLLFFSFFWVENSLHWLYITCFPVCQFVHLLLDPHIFLTQFDLTTVLRPAMMYGLNTVVLTKIQQVELEGDGIRNEYISGTAQAEQLETKLERKK